MGKVRISGFIRESIVDGPGFRYVIFFQGCKHKCFGCHNKETHRMAGGKIEDINNLMEDIKKTQSLDGVTISGGEPLLQIDACLEIVDRIRKETKLSIMLYTGYTLEQIIEMSKVESKYNKVIKSVDLVVDGPYKHNMRDLNLKFRGSKNQRIIDISRTKDISSPMIIV